MFNKFFFGSILFAVLLCISCGPKSAITVGGTISDAPNMNVYFDKVPSIGGISVLKNMESSGSGAFKFDFEEPLDEGLYRVRIGSSNATIYVDNQTKSVQINGDMNSLKDFSYTVEGNEASKVLQSNLQSIQKQRSRASFTKMIESDQYPLINLYLVNKLVGEETGALPYYKTIQKQLSDKLPGNENLATVNSLIANLEAKLKAQRKKQSKFNVGDVAPEIAMPDKNGKIRKLSDLKGKIVLIDFWASWCGPCRKANPHVVEMYDKYHKKGFDVFSVSLDGIHPRALPRYNGNKEKIAAATAEAKKKWLDAVKKDKLKWPNHVSDLKHWGTEINKVYGISSIPTTFLVGRDGTFAAINPRHDLEEQIIKALGE